MTCTSMARLNRMAPDFVQMRKSHFRYGKREVSMGLRELERTAKALTEHIRGREDVAVGSGLALRKHQLIGGEPSERCVDVYGSEEAYTEPLRRMCGRGLIRYHVMGIEYHPSIQDGIQILAFEDLVRIQAYRVAGVGSISRDFIYLAEINGTLGRGGVDLVLATSRLASGFSPDHLALRLRNAGFGRQYEIGADIRLELQNLARDLDLFSSASDAAREKVKEGALEQESMRCQSAMASIKDDIAKKSQLLKLASRHDLRQAEEAAQEVCERLEECRRHAVSCERKFIAMTTERLTTYRGFGRVAPGTRRGGLTPSTAHAHFYAHAVDRALNASPSYMPPPHYRESSPSARSHDLQPPPAYSESMPRAQTARLAQQGSSVMSRGTGSVINPARHINNGSPSRAVHR
ncbi:hypothetical protein ACIBQ5_36725 [Streptomyces massasporeus]|uniref:hypothetical protein n=1 Tax=Streptomyces massasporeus TaxID=67324 RepID=UPI0037AE7E18